NEPTLPTQQPKIISALGGKLATVLANGLILVCAAKIRWVRRVKPPLSISTRVLQRLILVFPNHVATIRGAIAVPTSGKHSVRAAKGMQRCNSKSYCTALMGKARSL